MSIVVLIITSRLHLLSFLLLSASNSERTYQPFSILSVQPILSTIMLHFFLALMLAARTCAEAKAVAVDIAIFGTYHPGIMVSLAYHRPAFDLAVDDANLVLAGKVNFSVNYLNVTSDFPCESVVDGTEFYLSQWYYQERRPTNEAATLIIVGGTVSTVNR